MTHGGSETIDGFNGDETGSFGGSEGGDQAFSGDEGCGAFVGGESDNFQNIENGTRVPTAALALGTRVTATLVDPGARIAA
jgi:hypothetical protein